MILHLLIVLGLFGVIILLGGWFGVFVVISILSVFSVAVLGDKLFKQRRVNRILEKNLRKAQNFQRTMENIK